jgi:regulatory protein
MARRRAPGPPARGCREDALALLARRSRSRAALAEALSRRGHEAREIAAALSDLARSGLIDDRQAAEAFLASRRGRYGAARMKRELRSRGFDAETARDAMAALDEPEERDALRRLCRRKLAELAGRPEPERRRKTFAFLARRGFAASDILAALRRPDADDRDF